VWGSALGVEGLGFEVSRLRIQVLGLRVEGVGFRVYTSYQGHKILVLCRSIFGNVGLVSPGSSPLQS